MARGRNKIFVEWLESKEKTNQVNVKQKIGDLWEVEKDSAVQSLWDLIPVATKQG